MLKRLAIGLGVFCCMAVAVLASEAKLRVINGSDRPIELSWLPAEGEPVSQGTIAPLGDKTITTTLGHRFQILDQREGASVTIESRVRHQAFRYEANDLPDAESGAAVVERERIVGRPPKGKGIPSFYQKYVEVKGYPIVGSANVDDRALLEAAYWIERMLASRPDVLEAMVASGSRLCIIAHDEFTTEIPEHAWLASGGDQFGVNAKDYWDARARGLGGSEYDPICSCGEENLLRYPGDPYDSETILIHEFAHNIHLRGMVNVDPTFDERLKRTYDEAMQRGLWAGKYASVNHHEYFAEGVQSWFDDNREEDHDHNHVNTRAELEEYDLGLASMCREVFGEDPLGYTRPETRRVGHLAGWDPSLAPSFVWPNRLREAQRRIREAAEERSRQGEERASQKAPEQGQEFRLTLERIFESAEFSGEGTDPYEWSPVPGRLWRWEASESVAGARDLWLRDAQTGEGEKRLGAERLRPEGSDKGLEVEEFQASADESKFLIFTNRRRVWRYPTRGDYWVVDTAGGPPRRLGTGLEPESLMFAKFSPDGERVAYVSGNDLYVESWRSGNVTKLSPEGPDTLIEGTSDWVNEEELDLRDCFRWSPDGSSIAFWQFDTSEVPRFRMLNTLTGDYPETIEFPYPKVGQTNSAVRIGVVSSDGGEVLWLKLPGDPRDHYVPRMEWSPDGNRIWVQQLDRAQRRNVVWQCSPKTGESRELFVETDSAWLENENPFRFLDGGKSLLWLSERSGWRHLYRVDLSSGELQPLTSGEFDVIEIDGVSEGERSVYFAASPDNATRRYLYRVSLDGGALERLTPSASFGWNTYDVSSDGRLAVHVSSGMQEPPVTELVSLPEHRTIARWAGNEQLREKLAALELPRVEFLQLKLADGSLGDAWYVAPLQVEGDGCHPLLCYVYGEPYGQTVRDAWDGSRGLWHWMLAQQGYGVVSVDNRGTRVPKGRSWRKSVHLQIGIMACEDQASAMRELLALRPELDAKRVGIWGWSGGGSMSLNQLFRYPQLYRTAMAVAPNPVQRFYDSIYQERYMGLLSENEAGYREGSPITHAQRMQGNLLLLHGTLDDNVHYQATERLIDELIRHGKVFSVVPYPGRSHSISEGDGTTSHLFRTMTEYLRRNLPVSEGE